MSLHPDYTILISRDSKLLQNEIINLQHKYLPDNDKWRKAVFWGDEPVADNFWNTFRQQGLFTESTFIICRKANEWNASIWKMLSRTLAISTPSIWPFLCLEVDYEKNRYKIPAYVQKTSCFSHAQKKGWLIEIPPLQGAALRKYVKAELKNVNLSLPAELLEKFLNTVQPDANAIHNEISRLYLLNNSHIPSELWLDTGISFTENDVFQIINCLRNGKLPQIWEYTSQEGQNTLLFLLLSLLAREIRQWWQIYHDDTANSRIYDLASKKQFVNKIGKDNLAKSFSLLADAEYQVKSGRQTPEQTLEFLLIQLAIIFKNNSIKVD